jgi:putative transposase
MTTRDIQDQLQDLYGVEISPTLISNVTNEVIEEVKVWQNRPLDKVYPIVYLDALVIKIQQDKRIISKTFYLALGVNACPFGKSACIAAMSYHRINLTLPIC